MTIRTLVLSLGIALLTLLTFTPAGTAQTAPPASVNTAHQYTPYEKLVLQNVTQFHKNFNNRDWDKNGPLVAENLHVNSNGVEFTGRDAFVKRIARFAGPFPDVKIDDQVIVVDGNKAVIRFMITGTQKGDFQTRDGVIPATNRPIKIDGMEFFTLDEQGKVVDLLTVEDIAGLLQQLKAKN